MNTLLAIQILLTIFDNKIFFDQDYINFLRYKNSLIKVESIKPVMRYEFYPRISKEQKTEKILFFKYEEMKKIDSNKFIYKPIRDERPWWNNITKIKSKF